MEKQEVRAVLKYFYFKGLTPQEIFTDMKETSWESPSLLLHIRQLQNGMLNLNVEDRHVKTRNAVDDHQLLSTNKLLKKLTNSS